MLPMNDAVLRLLTCGKMGTKHLTQQLDFRVVFEGWNQWFPDRVRGEPSDCGCPVTRNKSLPNRLTGWHDAGRGGHCQMIQNGRDEPRCETMLCCRNRAGCLTPQFDIIVRRHAKLGVIAAARFQIVKVRSDRIVPLVNRQRCEEVGRVSTAESGETGIENARSRNSLSRICPKISGIALSASDKRRTAAKRNHAL